MVREIFPILESGSFGNDFLQQPDATVNYHEKYLGFVHEKIPFLVDNFSPDCYYINQIRSHTPPDAGSLVGQRVKSSKNDWLSPASRGPCDGKNDFSKENLDVTMFRNRCVVNVISHRPYLKNPLALPSTFAADLHYLNWNKLTDTKIVHHQECGDLNAFNRQTCYKVYVDHQECEKFHIDRQKCEKYNVDRRGYDTFHLDR